MSNSGYNYLNNDNFGAGIPEYYSYRNAYNSTVNPSTVHIHNTGLQRFYARYLLQKAISVFEWTVPDSWARNYFLYTLYAWGFIAIVNTDRYGVICQQCGLSGFDLYYQPRNAIISNPLLRGILQPQIDVQCVLLRLQPDYGGIMDIVNYYADMLALCSESAGINLLNTRLAYVFAAGNKAQAESFKKLYDNIASGEPAGFVDKTLFDDEGNLRMEMFNQNLKDVYIAGDILDDMRAWEMKFDADIGIPVSQQSKKERLITDETQSAIRESRSKCDLWLDELKKGCEKARNMFDINIDVKWRDDIQPDMSGNGG